MKVDGTVLRTLRWKAGLTAEMLAEKAAPCSLQHICDIERGRRSPTEPLALRIATALGCDLSTFEAPSAQHVDS